MTTMISRTKPPGGSMTTRLRREASATVVEKPSDHVRWTQLVGWVVQLGGFTALLYLAGWTRTQETYRELGINPSLIQYSTFEYIGRSIDVVHQPLIAILVLSVALGLIHRRFVAPATKSSAGSGSRKVIRRLLITGSAMAALGFLLVVVSVVFHESIGKRLWIVPPMIMTVSGGMLVYANRTLGAITGRKLFDRWITYVLGALGIAGLLWGLLMYAKLKGKEFAHNFEANAASHPEIIVYSGKNLQIAGPGVRSAHITSDSKYPYCYRGLRLIAQSGNKYFMAPAGYQWGRDGISSISATDDIRVDLLYSAAPNLDNPVACTA